MVLKDPYYQVDDHSRSPQVEESLTMAHLGCGNPLHKRLGSTFLGMLCLPQKRSFGDVKSEETPRKECVYTFGVSM